MVFQLTGGELGHLFLLAERLAARRAFELDDIAFGITDIDGWTFTFCSVARLHWADCCTIRPKVGTNGHGIKRLYAEAEVVEISAFGSRGRATGTVELAIEGDEIDE